MNARYGILQLPFSSQRVPHQVSALRTAWRSPERTAWRSSINRRHWRRARSSPVHSRALDAHLPSPSLPQARRLGEVSTWWEGGGVIVSLSGVVACAHRTVRVVGVACHLWCFLDHPRSSRLSVARLRASYVGKLYQCFNIRVIGAFARRVRVPSRRGSPMI